MRALYFLMPDMAERFALLKYKVAVVLMFVGCKMLIAPWIKIPTPLALGGGRHSRFLRVAKLEAYTLGFSGIGAG
ncbi:hypothetical protein [Crenobacter cavernae]|uniref:hypothetical protein n=1 Tax=Crenobacter cavernae TaxID=2290923 RepID=UPI001FE8846D